MTTSSSASRKDSVYTLVGGTTQALLAERDRLEAFLAAFPEEYCGFNPDGSRRDKVSGMDSERTRWQS